MFPSTRAHGTWLEEVAVTGDRLLTAREVAEWLGVSPETVLRMHRRGDLPGFRLGSNVLRFSERDIEAWLEARRVTA